MGPCTLVMPLPLTIAISGVAWHTTPTPGVTQTRLDCDPGISPCSPGACCGLAVVLCPHLSPAPSLHSYSPPSCCLVLSVWHCAHQGAGPTRLSRRISGLHAHAYAVFCVAPRSTPLPQRWCVPSAHRMAFCIASVLLLSSAPMSSSSSVNSSCRRCCVANT
jgi:hypothetical protein